MRKIAVIQMLAFWGAMMMIISGSIRELPHNQVLACEENAPIYTVQPDDELYEIGFSFGHIRFWEAIYIANADLIENPDMIYPGQQLEIPYLIHSYKSSEVTFDAVLDNPFCEKQDLPLSFVDSSQLDYYTMDFLTSHESRGDNIASQNKQAEASGNDSEHLSEFREVFKSVVNADGSVSKFDDEQNSNDLDRQRDSVQQESERQIMMEIDGMVLDETRSKVGRDFYDVFYTNWQSPENASNFSIRIAEQPSPSLGTIIYVEVNDTETFRMRIQPRYDFIQQAGQYAVRQTHSHLQNNDHQLQIY